MYPNGILKMFELRVGTVEIAPGDNEILNSRSFRNDNIQVRIITDLNEPGSVGFGSDTYVQ